MKILRNTLLLSVLFTTSLIFSAKASVVDNLNSELDYNTFDNNLFHSKNFISKFTDNNLIMVHKIG